MIPLSNVNLGYPEQRAVVAALQLGMISGTGSYVGQFESALASQVGRKHALAVANGTVALELVLRALGIGAGDEVIVPALTFVAPAAAVRAVGATPVFADIDPDDWTIDPYDVQAQVKSATRAVIGVDLLGHPADFEMLRFAIDASRYPGVVMIEDAAEAHGASTHRIGRKMAGSFGDVSTFSFHGNKTITTGEGGAVLTNFEAVDSKLRLIANHGMTKERPYWHEVVGSNYRMTNLTAAIGLGQVERWDELVAGRNAVAAAYDAAFADLFTEGNLYRRPVASWATEACWLYTLAHPNRDTIVKDLREVGIDARAIWPALPDLPLYADSVRGAYPVARKISREAFWLPTWAGMPQEYIEQVADAVRDAIKGGIRVP